MKRLLGKYKKIAEKSYTTLAGSIAFFFIINGGSVIYLILLLTHMFEFDIYLLLNTEYMPEAVKLVLDSLYESSILINPNYSIFFIISSVISASSLFFHMIRTGELIYGEPRAKFSFLKRVISILCVIIFLVLVIMAFALLLIGDILLKDIKFTIALSAFKYVMMFIIPFLIVTFINLFITPHKVRLKEVIPGSLFTTVFWYISTYLFSIYLQLFANFKMIYGALTFIIIFMVWVYLMAQGLVIGFIINYEKKEKERITNYIPVKN